MDIMKNVCNAVMNMHEALTYFNTLQKPVNIKASALLIIHIWSKIFQPTTVIMLHIIHDLLTTQSCSQAPPQF